MTEFGTTGPDGEHVHGLEGDPNLIDEIPQNLEGGLAQLMEEMRQAEPVFDGLPQEIQEVLQTMLNVVASMGYIRGLEVGIPHQIHMQRIAAWDAHERGLTSKEGADNLNDAIKAVYAEYTVLKMTAEMNSAFAMSAELPDIEGS